jgi:hypothetical protein
LEQRINRFGALEAVSGFANVSVGSKAVKLETATGWFAPKADSVCQLMLALAAALPRQCSRPWVHGSMAPITVEAAAAGMLRSRHEQYRELGINLIDKCTGKTWLLARLLSFSASTPVKFSARGCKLSLE